MSTTPYDENGYQLEQEEKEGPDMRMTANGAEDLFHLITRARRDWSPTVTWLVVSRLHKERIDQPYAVIVIASMHCVNNPLISSAEAILEDGQHWNGVAGYLTTGVQGKHYTDAHSAQVLEQAKFDRRNVGGQAGPSTGYLAAKLALQEAQARRQA